jgi:3-deoxy-D-manno-octulosonic-acid transferase
MIWVYNAVLFFLASFYRRFRSFTLSKMDLSKAMERKEGETRIWIHASSLGETKAAGPLIDAIKEDLPQVKIFFSTGTATGYKEASLNRGKVDLCFHLPLDFSWSMKKLVGTIAPDLFILVESDFWYNLHRALKESSIPIVLVNGRISQKSYAVFKKVPFLATPIFSSIDLCCLQEEEYVERFQSLGVPLQKIQVTGNLKYDITKILGFDRSLHFPKEKHIVTIASTHNEEEALILSALKEMDSSICFLIAPRHPERFAFVKEYLEKENIPFRTISQKGSDQDRVVLVDKMGVLDQCFKVSDAAIIGGSFIKQVGGHNIYEPARFGIPVLYGPYMYKQEGLVKALKKHNIGAQVELAGLKSALEGFLAQKNEEESFKNLQSEMEGATKRSWQKIKSL